MENFFDSVMRALNSAKEQYGSGAALSEASGVSTVNISRWTRGSRSPKVEEISPIMDIIGARVILPGDIYTPPAEDTKRIALLEAQLSNLTKERDILKAQLDVLKVVPQILTKRQRRPPPPPRNKARTAALWMCHHLC